MFPFFSHLITVPPAVDSAAQKSGWVPTDKSRPTHVAFAAGGGPITTVDKVKWFPRVGLGVGVGVGVGLGWDFVVW
jgi:hypothetical protein